jgi:hypothetical protein
MEMLRYRSQTARRHRNQEVHVSLLIERPDGTRVAVKFIGMPPNRIKVGEQEFSYQEFTDLVFYAFIGGFSGWDGPVPEPFGRVLDRLLTFLERTEEGWVRKNAIAA